MTTPRSDEPGPDDRPTVDRVIHDAREGSWHLPETPATERPRPGHGNEPGEAPAHLVDPAPAGAPDHASGGASAARTAREAAAQPPPAGHGAAAVTGHSATSAATHTAASAAAHGAATAGHGGGHSAGHMEHTLGPVDVEMWGAGIVAALIGLFIAICFVLATAGVGAY